MDIKQRLEQVLERPAGMSPPAYQVAELCKDALARIRELEGSPDIQVRLRMEKAKHAKIGHRPREYAELCDAALERIEQLEAQRPAIAVFERLAGAIEQLLEQLAADRRRL
jgi:hypothetical protein